MRLFDGFGEPSPPRPVKSAAHPQKRIAAPWLLFASSRIRPLVHLHDEEVPRNPRGALAARCGYVARTITVDGSPLAPVCTTCLRISEGTPT